MENAGMFENGGKMILWLNYKDYILKKTSTLCLQIGYRLNISDGNNIGIIYFLEGDKL